MDVVVSAVVALLAGFFITAGADFTGQQERLCKAMGGTYTPAPAPANVCPGGQWSTLVGMRPQPR